MHGVMANHAIRKLWSDPRRRNVVRATLAYAVVVAVVALASLMFPIWLPPTWSPALVAAVTLIGFPVVAGVVAAFHVASQQGKGNPDHAATISDPIEKDAPEPGAEQRLDGWKRIGAHLNRDVRTLRRWEENEGLPIRRLVHDKLATVYAYRSELDAWLRQRGETPGHARNRNGNPNRRGAVVAAAAVAVLALGAMLVWFWPHNNEPAIAFGQWDWVLITEFDNRTGESVLDGTVEYALQRELANSRYVKVAPRERVNDALRLMKLPLDTRIDVKTGREISLRDGGIRMLIAGRIEKLGNTYQISAELVTPSDGVTMASFNAEASGQDQILPRIGDLANKVRAALGEGMASIKASNELLAKVTTPSLEALRLFSEANRVMASTDRTQALPILEQAVRIDPDFASAHLLLWYALKARDEMAQAEQHLHKAVDLADQTSERERLFIHASYYHGYLHDDAKAIETYQLLLRLYPDHFWANGNLANVYESLGRLKEAYPYRIRVAAQRPNVWYANYDALQFAIANGDAKGRNNYLAKTRAMPNKIPYLRAGLTMLPALEAWVKHDYSKTAAYTDELVAKTDPDTLMHSDDGLLFAQVQSMNLALGRLKRFRQLSALLPQPGWYHALLDFDSGHRETLDTYLKGRTFGFWNATLSALAGHTEAAKAAIDDPRSAKQLPPFFQLRAWKNLARAELALSESRYAEVVDRLDNNTMVLNIVNKTQYLFAIHSLAQAFVALGEPEKAIDALETARLQRPLTIFEPNAPYMWQRDEVYLHELYKRQGKQADAARITAELRESLRLADPGYPFLAVLDDRNSNPR